MRVDNTGFGDIVVLQNEGLGYGVDSVLLAAFAAGETGAKEIKKGARVADLGSGSGIVGFVLCHKIPEVTVLGVEKRASACDRAVEAAKLSKIDDRVQFVVADVKGYTSSEEFDAVVTNPPYFRKSAAIPNEDSDKFIARHETSAELADFIETAARMLKNGGDLYMVHRPDRLADIFCEMRNCRIEPKELQLVVPHPGEVANIALVHGVKGAGSELRMLEEIAVHDTDGKYTNIIEEIYERRKTC